MKFLILIEDRELIIYKNYLFNNSFIVEEITELIKVSVKKLSQKGYNDKDNEDFKFVKIIIALLTLLSIIKKLSVKSATFFIYLLFLINLSLSVLLMKLFYIKTIIKFVISSKVISIEDFLNKTNFLIFFNNDNVLFSTELIIIILIIEDVKMNILLLYINKKIMLLILIIK